MAVTSWEVKSAKLIIETWSIEKNFLVEKYAENVHLKLVRDLILMKSPK